MFYIVCQGIEDGSSRFVAVQEQETRFAPSSRD